MLFVPCALRRVTNGITADNEVRFIIWDTDLGSKLTGGDETKRYLEKVQSYRSMNQVWQPDIPDFGCIKNERESHHDEVTALRQTLQRQRVG